MPLGTASSEALRAFPSSSQPHQHGADQHGSLDGRIGEQVQHPGRHQDQGQGAEADADGQLQPREGAVEHNRPEEGPRGPPVLVIVERMGRHGGVLAALASAGFQLW